MKTNFLVFCSDQVVNDVGAGGVPSRVAKPLAAGWHVAARDTCRVVDPAVPAGVLHEVSLAIVVPVIPRSGARRLLEAEGRDPRGQPVRRRRRPYLRRRRPRRRRG